MTIEVTKAFIECLNKAQNINQALRLIANSNELRSRSENKTMFMSAPIDVVMTRDVNIYDLREFISVLNLVDEPHIDLSKDNIILVKSKDNKQKLRYIECEEDMVSSYAENDPDLKRIELTVSVSEAQFASVINAAKRMKLPYVGFVGDGDKVNLVAFNRHEGDGKDTNSYSIEICDSPTEDSFNMYFDLNVNEPAVILNEGDLTIDISSSPKAVKVQTASGRTFFLAFASKSEFGV